MVDINMSQKYADTWEVLGGSGTVLRRQKSYKDKQ